MTVWATPAQAATHWPDATNVGEAALVILLTAAQDICEAYAPALTTSDPSLVEDPPGSGLFVTGWADTDGDGLYGAEVGEVPERYMLATIYQARELWAASKRDGDVIGLGDGYALRSRPLTGVVKSLLRPQRGVPVLG